MGGQILLKSWIGITIGILVGLEESKRDQNTDIIKKADESFRKLFKNLRDELENKGIHLELRVIIDPKTKSPFHDRWIISKNKCFNVTSTDVAARGQYSEIRETSNRPPFVEWWKNSKDIIKDWNRIKKHFNKQLSFKQNF